MDLLQFIGSYWWLAFPLLGAAGAAAGTWEKAARRRHKRRLEILRAESELKSARAPGAARPDLAPAAPAQESTQTQLERLFAAHDAVTARWLEYELDVAKLIAFPAMSDGREPLTAAFLRAKRVADNLRPASTAAKLTPQELTEYRDAVTDYEVAFDLAERDARRIRDTSFSPAERKRLETAQQLLTVAVDEAATPAERQLAYRRVREELDGLLSLSDEAVEVLERKVALELLPSAGAPLSDDAETSQDAETRQDAETPREGDATTVDRRPPGVPRAPSPGPTTPDTAPGRIIRPKPSR